MSEYIKKSELFDKTVRRNSIWNEVTNSEGKGLEEIVNDLPTYSFPDSAKPKREYIDKIELVRKLNAWDCKAHGIPNYAWRVINEVPTYSFTNSDENKGEWEMPVQDDGMSDPIYYQVRCSKCGFDLDPQIWYHELHEHGADNYCPNCGADMREVKE